MTARLSHKALGDIEAWPAFCPAGRLSAQC